MKRIIALSVAVPGLLAACTATPMQKIAIETPGAEGAVCFLERPGYRERVWAPQTVQIEKNADPLGITCRASGNREQTVVLDPAENYNSAWSDAFPRKVVVDFSDVKLRADPLPAQEFVVVEPDPVVQVTPAPAPLLSSPEPAVSVMSAPVLSAPADPVIAPAPRAMLPANMDGAWSPSRQSVGSTPLYNDSAPPSSGVAVDAPLPVVPREPEEEKKSDAAPVLSPPPATSVTAPALPGDDLGPPDFIPPGGAPPPPPQG